MTVRPFCNADLPDLVRLWNDHWSMLMPGEVATMAQLELAILGRTFFLPEALLVATSESEPATIDGWCLCYPHVGRMSDGLVAVICLSSECDSSVGDQLVAAAEQATLARGMTCVHVGVIRDRDFGLAGLSPIGHGIGVPSHDFRVTSVLGERGYSGQRLVQRMTASVAGYRGPVSRESIQLRRSTQINMVPYIESDQRAAAAMSHLDIEMHMLIDRDDQVIARVNLWFSDPEAEVMNPAMAILDLSVLESPDLMSAAEVYLVGTAISSLIPRGIAVVETAIDSENSTLIGQLESLQFSGADTGIGWTKQLA